ncbi:molybdopterin-guanine dinucleotide biosynthesis protein B [Clostridium senegalense]|uniref:Molybdopterin-guanine dinucleotide biosynthesis protein B n=1 Tax=Clostridium senegalense TaxID=1465809 RepID=A0A6M0H541_9CLOT|nr:molybdopterin-guanine dinucleotide biosynthesis protein B [Clostridium senegalense]NEU05739.1 molybdopterin-guanine dinucleotide biosynthesis protein B [Clostridium senegalense]
MENLSLNKKVCLKIISIVATKSGTGKTTLIEKLIPILKEKNWKVGVLKHDAHKFEMDKEGKDTYRFAQAGADNVIISSSTKLAMIQTLKEERTIEDILPLFKDVDLVIVEGFKNNKYPKIEVHRNVVDNNFLYNDLNFKKDTFIALASDEELEVDIPVLDINNPMEVVKFIEDKILNEK